VRKTLTGHSRELLEHVRKRKQAQLILAWRLLISTSDMAEQKWKLGWIEGFEIGGMSFTITFVQANQQIYVRIGSAGVNIRDVQIIISANLRQLAGTLYLYWATPPSSHPHSTCSICQYQSP
jgi:hypothetical protein